MFNDYKQELYISIVNALDPQNFIYQETYKKNEWK